MKIKKLLSLVLAALTMGISASGFASEPATEEQNQPVVVSQTERILLSAANVIRQEIATVYSNGITTVDEITAEYESAEEAAIVSGRRIRAGTSAREAPRSVNVNQRRDIITRQARTIGHVGIKGQFLYIPGNSVYINSYSTSKSLVNGYFLTEFSPVEENRINRSSSTMKIDYRIGYADLYSWVKCDKNGKVTSGHKSVL